MGLVMPRAADPAMTSYDVIMPMAHCAANRGHVGGCGGLTRRPGKSVGIGTHRLVPTDVNI